MKYLNYTFYFQTIKKSLFYFGAVIAPLCMTISYSHLHALSIQDETNKAVSAPFTIAAKKAIPSVVSIKAQIKMRAEHGYGQNNDFFNDELWERFFGLPPQGKRKQKIEPQYGFGSGFIVSKDGYIMTNNHVVDKATRITVQLSTGKEYTAKLVGRDPNTDIALLKIEATSLPALSFADSTQLDIGEWLLVIGNPLALRASVTAGVVSALGRSDLNIMRVEEFIQTDAAINHGNSGGPVINLDGNVIGMATAIASSSAEGGNIGIGFAISSNLIQDIMKDIIEHGKAMHGYLGFIPQTVDDEIAKALGLNDIQGVLVAEVVPQSPAAAADIQIGDVITEIDGKPVLTAGMVRRSIALMKPGQSTHLAIVRNGKAMTLQATIGAAPDSSDSLSDSIQEDILGITVEPITAQSAQQYNTDAQKGLIIVDIETDTVAYEAGLRVGYVILSVNGETVSTKTEFTKAVQQAIQAKRLLMQVKVGKVTRFFPIRMEG